MSFCGRRTYTDVSGKCHNIVGKTVHEIEKIVKDSKKSYNGIDLTFGSGDTCYAKEGSDTKGFSECCNTDFDTSINVWKFPVKSTVDPKEAKVYCDKACKGETEWVEDARKSDHLKGEYYGNCEYYHNRNNNFDCNTKDLKGCMAFSFSPGDLNYECFCKKK